MEIPTATIHRLLSSIREGTTAAPPAPTFPSVADAVAAFEPDASPELLCGRCGAAGGLLRGAQSAVCVYCGSPRRGEGDGIAFRGSAAYQWLLGSLRLDGSALVEFDGDSTDSNKSKETPKSGLVLSDLLDLKLTFPPENREISGSSTSNKQPSVACILDLPGVNLDSFSIERKKEIAASTAALPPTHTMVQEKHSRSHESSSSEMHITSKGFDSLRTKTGSQSTNQMESTTAFANWDAHFQSTGSGSVVGDSKQLDLFQSASVAEPSNFPVSGTAIRPVLAAGNQTNIESEDLASALNVDNLSIQKVVSANAETNLRMVAGNNVAEFTGSSLDKNSVENSELSGRSDIGVSTDEAFDDWQEFTEGGNQGTVSNVGEHTERPLVSDSSEIKGTDPLPIGSMESSNNVAESDDWQAFAQSSAQGDSVKLVEESSSGQGRDGMGNPVAELEHSLEAHAVDLWPAGNVKEHNSTEIVEQTDDSFDDWQDFTTPGQARVASFNEAGKLTGEIDVDSWFTENTRESSSTGLVNGNNIMMDDWQGFAGSDQTQQSSYNVGGELMDISFEQLDGTGPVQLPANVSSNKTTNIVSANMEDNTFDIWQDVAAPRHQQKSISNLGRETTGVSSVPAKEIDSMDLWLTSNIKESNSCSTDVSGIHESPDTWQDYASFGQAQGNMKIPVEGQFVKDPSGAEPVDLWSSSHTEQFKNLEQINANNDPFDEWQDFKNSPELETSLQGQPGAPLSDKPSVLAADMTGLEFGSFPQSVPSQRQIHNKQDNSNEANAAPPGEHERMGVMQQMGDVDALSATSHDSKSRPKSEAGNANVEKLLSQMHDLSFMLKDELSVPAKSAGRSEP
ncbi:hypothetical protein CFC21_007987 [Triticum aestivum]|uniref:DUF7815 domain-containing protein n=2 Tax=Triticum aestivum TaxID=4565 RepID=A0A3B5Z0X2_WHEAT|nr:uncharacterized protein LOC123138135 [Triticum aestivum]KAF6990834.1 hypothetical protein CFC21_007987 [Triticum aestivum]